MSAIRAALAGCLMLVACEAAPGDAPITKEDARERGGKADDGTDLCEEQSWYGDGVCDDFCPKPDFDCGLPVCDPYGDRQLPPELVVGADEIAAAAAAAEVSIDALVHEDGAVDALVAAAGRGVAVRAIIDGDEPANAEAAEALAAAGVEVRASAGARARLLVIDRATALFVSGELGVLVRDADDVIDAQAVFDADWLADGAQVVQPDLSCTRLVVSPLNARERLAGFCARADERLDLALTSLTDPELIDSLGARAEAGVPVRVLLAAPALVAGNQATADELGGRGVAVRFAGELGAHLVLADQLAFAGAGDLSAASLDRDRAVGLFVGGEAAAEAGDRFEAAWAAAD